MSCLGRASRNSLAVCGFLAAAASLVCMLFTDSHSVAFADLLFLSTAVFLVSLTIFFAFELKKYGTKIFHRFDEDIIGGAFTGLDRNSRLFEAGVHTFFDGDFEGALEYFTDLDSENNGLTEEEQGVLSFYRGRCYNIMNMYPNAAANYEKAVQHGFKLAELPLFMARCYAETGNTRKAVDILKGIMDTDHQYSSRARYEIGNIYLKLNQLDEADKWFSEAIEKRESYAEALGGQAICCSLRRDFTRGEEYYKMAMLNHIENPDSFVTYYKRIQAAVILGKGGGIPKK